MNTSQQNYYNQIKEIVEEKGGKVVSDRYVKMTDKMWFICPNGHKYDTEARSIFKNMKCRYCHGNTREQGEANFRKLVSEKGGVILGEYKGNHKKVLVRCNNNHEWQIQPSNLTNGKWCRKCHHLAQNYSENFINVVKSKGGKVIGEYVDAHTKVEVKCNQGHKTKMNPNSVISSNLWCSICTKGSGKAAISKYLQKRNIPYEKRVTIKGLCSKPYDFLLDYNGYKIIIEYDTIYHFKYSKYYHGTPEFFQYYQLVDRVKTDHAIDQGYRIVRIDYKYLLIIDKYLDWALAVDDLLCYGCEELYDSWITIECTKEEYALVNKNYCRNTHVNKIEKETRPINNDPMTKKQQEQYDKIKNLVEVKGGRVVSEKYERSKDFMEFVCAKDHEFETTGMNIIAGKFCRYCSNTYEGYGQKVFAERVEQMGGKVLGNYVNNKTSILIECSKGHRYSILPSSFKPDKGCSKCAHKIPKNHDKFLIMIEKQGGVLLGPYVNAKTKVKIRCTNSHEFWISPDNTIFGKWCRLCKSSGGENLIMKYLDSKNIAYQREISIPGLERRKYDFALEHNGHKIIIEFDGGQHFRFIKHYHVTEDFFRSCQIVDRVKTYHALNNGYRVIRIDNKNILNIVPILDEALESTEEYILSDPFMYEWLSAAEITEEDIKMTNNHIPRPKASTKDSPKALNDTLVKDNIINNLSNMSLK